MRRSRGRGRKDHHDARAREEEDSESESESFTAKPLHQDHRHTPSLDHSASPSQGRPHHNFVPRNNHRTSWRNHGQHQQVKFRFVKKFELASPNSDPAVPEADHLRQRVASLSVGAESEEVEVTPPAQENHQQQERESETDEARDGNENDHASSSSKANEGDNILRRLDKLLSDIEEQELSEEQLRINDQSQEDELLVMESIYGENVHQLERWKGLRCFQIHIHIEVLGEIGITAKLNSSNELEAWLQSIKIFSLCSKLDSIWAEQQGQEVIYQWVEWLHGSSLSHLGFDKEITLGPCGTDHVGDERVVSGTISLDVDIPVLRSYNNERHHENFLNEWHKCSICYSEYAGTEFVWLPCKHFFCWKCLQTFTHMHVKEGTISNLQCPEAKCAVVIPPGLLKRLLGDEEYERWESLMLEKTLASMSDVAYCPRCETPCIEDEDHHAQCSRCLFSFCTLCRERRHVGTACMTLDMKLQILQERQNSSLLKEDQRRRELDKINEMLNMKVIHRDSKLCPSCHMAISRTEGCNKMKCSNCEQYFCYRCNKAIDGSDPYAHFRDGLCELFPQEMIEDWQERINHRQVVRQVQAQLFPQRGLPCPNCRQFNAKVGNNNHLFCWACQSHYCYLCKEIVRRSTQHYGPKGCKQHTEG